VWPDTFGLVLVVQELVSRRQAGSVIGAICSEPNTTNLGRVTTI
jgi:hypothetical protein